MQQPHRSTLRQSFHELFSLILGLISSPSREISNEHAS